VRDMHSYCLPKAISQNPNSERAHCLVTDQCSGGKLLEAGLAQTITLGYEFPQLVGDYYRPYTFLRIRAHCHLGSHIGVSCWRPFEVAVDRIIENFKRRRPQR